MYSRIKQFTNQSITETIVLGYETINSMSSNASIRRATLKQLRKNLFLCIALTNQPVNLKYLPAFRSYLLENLGNSCLETLVTENVAQKASRFYSKF